MRVVLHHRGAEGVLERLAVLDGDVLHGLHRVEVLGQRHRQPGIAQFGDEAGEEVEHGDRGMVPVDYLSTPSSFAALAMSVWYFSRMWSVSLACWASMWSMPSSTSVRAQSMVSLTDGAFLRSSWRMRAHDAGDLVGQVGADLRAPW